MLDAAHDSTGAGNITYHVLQCLVLCMEEYLRAVIATCTHYVKSTVYDRLVQQIFHLWGAVVDIGRCHIILCLYLDNTDCSHLSKLNILHRNVFLFARQVNRKRFMTSNYSTTKKCAGESGEMDVRYRGFAVQNKHPRTPEL